MVFLARKPEYKLLVDWFNHGGLALSNHNWTAVVGADAERSTEQYIMTPKSYKVTWDPDATERKLYRYFDGPILTNFTLAVWIYIPTGGTDTVVSLFVEDTQVDTVTVTARDEWFEAEVTSAAAIGQIELRITDGDGIASGAFIFDTATPLINGFDNGVFAAGSTFYIGTLHIETEYDDVTCYLASTSTIPDASYGRDSARDLETIKAGEFQFELNNDTGRFTPGNSLSPLLGQIDSNRAIRFSAVWNNLEYVLFNGSITDLQINAQRDARTAAFKAHDMLSRFVDDKIHTELLRSCRTGDAIHAILDAAEFDGPRDIDPGASTLRWYGRGDVTVKEALDHVLKLEGPPAIYFMSEDGGFVFLDRNHRLVRDHSTASMATLYECGDEGSLWWQADGSDIHLGWTDVINVIEAQATIERPGLKYESVWSSEETYELAIGETKTLEGAVDGGYMRAQDPVGVEVEVANNYGPDAMDVVTGAPEDTEYDYLIKAGTVQVTNEILQGTKVKITIENTGASVAKIQGMKLRARQINKEDLKREYRSEDSISSFGAKKTESLDLQGLCEPDVEAISDKILLSRGFPRPMFDLSLLNVDDTHMEQQLSRDISDRLTIESSDETWAFQGDVFIEAIDHYGGQEGKEHRTTFHCEADPHVTYDDAFTFGSSTHTFSTGVFQGADLVTSDNVFRLDNSVLGGGDKLAY